MKFDTVSFTKEGYEKFTQLTKEKQIEKLSNLLNPKDDKRAEKLLKHIPNGDIIQGDGQETEQHNETGTAEGSSEFSGNGQKSRPKKSKD